MGNDGGSIPTRRELVKEAARNPTASEVKEAQQEKLEYRWSTCPLSLRKLQEPVVSDAAGVLYNKDAIIELLLPHELTKEELALGGRVSSMKDVVEVKFEREGRWICPVTRRPLATTRSVYIVPCGHAFAESAVREITDTLCPTCSTPFERDDIVAIFATDNGAARMKRLKERGVSHSLRGKRKRKTERENGKTDGKVNGKTDSRKDGKNGHGEDERENGKADNERENGENRQATDVTTENGAHGKAADDNLHSSKKQKV